MCQCFGKFILLFQRNSPFIFCINLISNCILSVLKHQFILKSLLNSTCIIHLEDRWNGFLSRHQYGSKSRCGKCVIVSFTISTTKPQVLKLGHYTRSYWFWHHSAKTSGWHCRNQQYGTFCNWIVRATTIWLVNRYVHPIHCGEQMRECNFIKPLLWISFHSCTFMGKPIHLVRLVQLIVLWCSLSWSFGIWYVLPLHKICNNLHMFSYHMKTWFGIFLLILQLWVCVHSWWKYI